MTRRSAPSDRPVLAARPTERRRARSLGRPLLAGLALVSVVLGVPGVAGGQEGESQPATVTKEAYFTSPASEALPSTLTRELPPGIVCILVPQACQEAIGDLTQPAGDVISQIETPDASAPAQAVEPNTLPVSLFGGVPRYTSALRFEVPRLPEGSIISRFELILDEATLSYSLESPAFRQAVLTALQQASGPNPEALQKLVVDAATQTTPLATTRISGVEACPTTADFQPGAAQPSSAAPAVDCITGTTGIRNDDGTWTFDLSFAAQSWIDGDAQNLGIGLRPVGSDNLAFGDPDLSTNFQVSFSGAQAGDEASRPRLRVSFTAGGEEETLDVALLDEGGVGGDGSGTALASVDPFGAPPTPVVDTVSGEPIAVGPESSGGAHRLAASSNPRTPWYLWLLIPLGILTIYVFDTAAASSPVPVRAGTGALSRLTARRRATTPGAATA